MQKGLYQVRSQDEKVPEFKKKLNLHKEDQTISFLKTPLYITAALILSLNI